MEKALYLAKKIIPPTLFNSLSPAYHFAMSVGGAVFYRFPARKITVIGVTGTKGKTSTTEIVNAILEKAGYKTALCNTIRFKVDDESKENLFKMSMPGRFFVQRLIRRAVNKGCQFMVMEVTSQGVLQHRQKFLYLDALIFTNLAPEHIESHGSYENYVAAKLKIAESLAASPKKRRILVVNSDDKESPKFLAHKVEEQLTYSLDMAKPYLIKDQGVEFTFDSAKFVSPLSGAFNVYNMLGALTVTKAFGVATETSREALASFSGIPGRVERIIAGQDFNVVVDYAHTPDSLEKVYQVFAHTRLICVLGNTGGGRDKWKRTEMGKIADTYCDEIILTNEDPYDEDPQAIVEDMRKAMSGENVEVIMDRRMAIAHALSRAKTGESVLITGKGTDPYIMGPNGTKQAWSDAKVAREEIMKLLSK